MALSASDCAGDGTVFEIFRHGEAPGEERELRIVALIAHEVELIREPPGSFVGLLFLAH